MKNLHIQCGPYRCGCELLLGQINFTEVLTFWLCDFHAELLEPELRVFARKMKRIVHIKPTSKSENEKPECRPAP